MCVSAGWRRGRSLSLFTWLRLLWIGLPVVGGRYTITRVGQSDLSRLIVVQLQGFGDVWFALINFRPVLKSSCEQDVALFTPLLDPTHPKIADDVPQVPA